MNAWNSQSLTMKRLWIGLAILTVVIVVHGTITFRANHQIAFAQGVEQRIDIETVHVKAVSGVLVLYGKATREQSEFAEGIARQCIEKYARRSINPPTSVRNDIEVGSVVTKHERRSQRGVASTRKH